MSIQLSRSFEIFPISMIGLYVFYVHNHISSFVSIE